MKQISSSSASALGMIVLVISLVCLGTWPALIRLCTWGEKARHPCHVYIDYSLSYVVSSCVPILASLLLKSEQGTSNHDASFVVIAMVGGALLSFGNIAFQWAVVVFGAPLTTVLAIQASLTVVLGTSLNFLLEPDQTARPNLLMLGVLAFLVAISFATWAQISYVHSKHRENYTECGEIYSNSNHGGDNAEQKKQGGLIALPTILDRNYAEHEVMNQNTKLAESFYSDQAPNRTDSFYSDSSVIAPPGQMDNTRMGLCVAFTGGLCFGFFSPAFNIAVNDPFQWSSSNGGLSVAMANIWFSIAFCCSSIIGNTLLMTSHSDVIPHSTFWLYLTQETWSQRRLALLGGLICALGNLLQFQGGKLAGFATADLVQVQYIPSRFPLWSFFVSLYSDSPPYLFTGLSSCSDHLGCGNL